MKVMNKGKGMYSIREIYRIGRGPSSSHTMGPESACQMMLEDYPQATFFQVVFERTEKEQLFLGSVRKTTAKVRAYSFK